MDGYVTIGTKLDTDGLDQGLTRLESGLKSTESKMNKYGKNSICTSSELRLKFGCSLGMKKNLFLFCISLYLH